MRTWLVVHADWCCVWHYGVGRSWKDQIAICAYCWWHSVSSCNCGLTCFGGYSKPIRCLELTKDFFINLSLCIPFNFPFKTLNASILEDKFSSPISQSWNMKRRAEAVEDSGIPYVCTGYKRSNRLRKQRLSSLSSQKILSMWQVIFLTLLHQGSFSTWSLTSSLLMSQDPFGIFAQFSEWRHVLVFSSKIWQIAHLYHLLVLHPYLSAIIQTTPLEWLDLKMLMCKDA